MCYTFNMLQCIFNYGELLHWLPETEIQSQCHVRSFFSLFVAHRHSVFFLFSFFVSYYEYSEWEIPLWVYADLISMLWSVFICK
jgi:hypothetical protein